MISSSESADLCLGRWCGAVATEMPFEDLHACDSQHAGAPRNAATNTSTRRHSQAYQLCVELQGHVDTDARAVHGIGLTGPTRFVAATTAQSLEPHRRKGSHASVAPRVIVEALLGPAPLMP